MLSRLVRIFNIVVAILVVLIAIAVYWYAIRPLPKTSGAITAPIDGDATIARDALGVPHIDASSWEDAMFLQGYVTAQDRLWQMDGLRRFGSGELAEVFGSSALPTDEQSRRMRMKAMADADARRLTPSERAAFVAYARGVNYFIDTHASDYSLEFDFPGHEYDPKPWTVTDSLVTGLVMYRDLTDTAKSKLDKAWLLANADQAKAKILFPAVEGAYVNPGSNAWAVSGARTLDDKPILANDPHLAYHIPSTWYMVQLKGPGFDVSGVSLPGVPGVIGGHNQQIAWGMTNLEADVMDLYAERMDPRNGHYMYEGKLEQASLDRQMIGVKGKKPVEVDTWITRHGPVIVNEHGRTFAMRWTADEGLGFPFLAIDLAQNWSEFEDALSHYWGPAQNFVYADAAGNIGYQAAGKIPIRRGFDSDIPLDGASGKFEWDGYIPFEQMPRVYNPSSGIVATANQDPFQPSAPYRVDGSFADPYRIQQIRALLAAKPKLDVADMLTVQKDVYSAYDRFLAQQAIAAFHKLGSGDSLLRDAVGVLRNWNGQMDQRESAPLITQLLSRELGLGLIRRILHNSAGGQIPDMLPRPFVIQKLLESRPAGWMPNNDWDSWVLGRFQAALQEGRRLEGSRVANWKWGALLKWNMLHPVGRQIPFAARFFDIGPVPMSGSGTTVKQTTSTLGPSERMVVDLGNLDRSVQNLVTGESGFVASKHYKDQWPAYYVGKSFPMEFDHVEPKEVLRVTPQQ